MMRKRDALEVAAIVVVALGLHLGLVYAAGGWPFVVVALFAMAICGGVDALCNRNGGRVTNGRDKP